MPRFLDLFAGAGGLSEGFIQAGYTPIAHVEMDAAACYTLKTRAAFHWLRANGNIEIYNQYLRGEMTRADFYKHIPQAVLDTVLNYEISSDTISEIFNKVDSLLGGRELDLIIGGPPCQAYSLAGRSRSATKMVGDKRNYLYKHYAEFLRRYKPRYFVFENVSGLLSAKDEDGSLHFSNMQNLFKEYGYSTEFRLLNASEYGVLQNRKRIILIGKYGEDSVDFYPDIPKDTRTHKVGELFCDLPPIHAGEGEVTPTPTNHYTGKYLFEAGIKEYDGEPVTFHQARPHTQQDLEIYRIVVDTWNKTETRIAYTDLPEYLRTHRNTKCFLDRFKVVAGNLTCSQTVVAHICRDGHYYIHPDIKQNRSLTPREAARIQTFPDNYYFECWDLDYIIHQENWSLQFFPESELEDLPGYLYLRLKESGTVVIWEEFDRLKQGASKVQKAFDEKIELTRKHVSLVFHRFLNDENPKNRLSIYFNGEAVKGIDPFLTKHPATQPLSEQVLRIASDEIRVKPYVLPYISKLSKQDIAAIGGKEELRQQQGFYIYRNKRLIIWGTWFRLIKHNELGKLARVRVDIPNSLDHIWEIDIKKSRASLPHFIKKNLVDIVENTIGRSERVYKYRGRNVQTDNLVHVWNPIDDRGRFQYQINRELPVIKMLEANLSEGGGAILEAFIKMLEDAFPYSDVYYRMAKSEANVTEGALETNEVYSMAEQMVHQIENMGGDVAAFLKTMDKMDFFIKYPDVVSQIREVYGNDG